jgi:hypothetical protein
MNSMHAASYITKIRQDFKERDRLAQEFQMRNNSLSSELAHKRSSYGYIVKELYAPTIDKVK